ncbi:MAG TPA: NADH-quinone oxidoreductase subunit M [Nocardioidaceae bacterium]|nr:NADH-quinone oxidoreductase subunit M [Nocardioidaceae bacterium]
MGWLSLVVLAPVLAAAAVWWRGARWSEVEAARVGVGASAVSLILAWLIWLTRDASAVFSGEVDHVWIPALDVHWHLGMDGISYCLVLLTTALSGLCCLSLARERTADEAGQPGRRSLLVLILVIESASLGVFTALDLVLFFICFELALIPMWFVIAGWGDPHDPAGRRRAATRFLLFTVLGSALMFVGFIGIAWQADTLQIDALSVSAPAFTGTLNTLLAVAIALGLAVKTPILPLHIWLPDAHAKAPTVGSVLLAGVFLKLGTYGFVRILVPIMPVQAAQIGPYLAAFGVAGIVYAALACLRQSDLKRLIAYSSVGHMGFVALGIGTLTASGLTAAVFISVAHGLITGLLFFLAGWLKERYGSSDLAALGHGMYRRSPWLAVAFCFGCLASLGVPGLAGFWGEMLALRGAYEVGPTMDRAGAWTLLGIAALGIVVTTAYFVGLIRRLLQGTPSPDETIRHLWSDDPQPGDQGPDDSGRIARPQVTDQLQEAEDDGVVDLDREQGIVTGVLAVSVFVLGIVPGLLSGTIAQAMPWIVGGIR